jgi:hypothetical protein
LLFQNIRFWQFLVKIKEGAKLKKLKIQGVLRHEIGLRYIMEPRWKKSKPKAEAKKSDGPILDSGGSGFLRIDRVQLGFEI